MANLKKCPFCSGQAEISLQNMKDYNNCFVCRAYCTECGASIKKQYTVPYGSKRPDYEAKQFIAKQWNQRST